MAVGEEDAGLRRVISGGGGAGRRKSSFGVIAGGGGGGGAGAAKEEGAGAWYWRVQAGVNEADATLVLLALSNPPNPVLTSPPGPLSAAMPSHAAHPNTKGSGGGTAADDDADKPGIADKIKNIFRRSSVNPDGSGAAGARRKSMDVSSGGAKDAPGPATGDGPDATGTGVGAAPDVILDQNAAGDPIPSPSTTVTSAQAHAGQGTAAAEHGWPGVINGERLVAVTVPLHAIDKARTSLGGGKKNEGSWIIVPVSSSVHGKAGTLRLEFDKDWIGAKAEAEVLFHAITTALDKLDKIEASVPADVRLAGKPQGDGEYKQGWQDNVRGKW